MHGPAVESTGVALGPEFEALRLAFGDAAARPYLEIDQDGTVTHVNAGAADLLAAVRSWPRLTATLAVAALGSECEVRAPGGANHGVRLLARSAVTGTIAVALSPAVAVPPLAAGPPAAAMSGPAAVSGPEADALVLQLLAESPVGMGLVGLDGAWLEVNPALCRMTGYDRADLLRATLADVTHPEDCVLSQSLADRVLSGDVSSYQLTKRFVRPDGSSVWCLVNAALVRDPCGSPRHFLYQAMNVDREQRNAQLLDVVFTASPDLICLTDFEGAILRASPSWSSLLGWSEAELLGTRSLDLVHPDDIPHTLDAMTRMGGDHRDVHPLENRFRAQDGSYRRLQWNVVVLPDRGIVVGSARDVTATHTAHELLATQARELDRNRLFLQAVLDHVPDAVVACDPHGTLTVFNPAAERLHGRAAEPLPQAEWAEGFRLRTGTGTGPPSPLPAGDVPLVRALRGEQVVADEMRIERAPDDIRTVLAHGQQLVSDAGELLGAVVMLRDVTEERTAEQQRAELNERETERLRTTVAVQREVTALATDRALMLRTVATRAADVVPRADGAVVELLEDDLLHYSAAHGRLESFLGTRMAVEGSLAGLVIATGQTLRCDDTGTDPRVNREACRKIGIGSMLIAPLFSAGRTIGSLKISSVHPHVFDTADEQQLTMLADSLSAALRHADDYAEKSNLLEDSERALQALEDSEFRFRLAFDNSAFGMFLTGAGEEDAGTLLQANAAMSRITGFAPAELVGRRSTSLVHEDDRDDSLSYLVSVREGNTSPRVIEKRFVHREGHVVWVRLSTSVMPATKGRTGYLMTQVEDVTERRATRERLRLQAQLLDLTPDAVAVRSLEGVISYWNPAAEQMYGWPAPVAVGRTIHRLLVTVFPPGESQENVHEQLLQKDFWSGELQQLRSDGRRLTVLSRQTLQRDAEGRPLAILCVNTDITDRRRAERALAQSEQRFRSQFDHSAVGQIIRGVDDLLEEVNPAFAAMVGLPADSLVSSRLASLIAPESRPEHESALASVFSGERDYYSSEGRLLRADGSTIDVHSSMSVIRRADGRPERFVGLFEDISERRRAEAERDTAAAELAERNSLLETTNAELELANQLKLDLIGMLGHEIGNPLAAILGYTELAADSWDSLDDAARRDILAVVARQAGRVDDLLREVLTMVTADAGRLTARPQPVALAEQIRTACVSTGNPPGLADGCPEDLSVLVQQGHLQQILVNLLTNAQKYGGGATLVAVETTPDRVWIRVEDGGPGVPEEFRAQLFERFSRASHTAHSVQGTGLGLYIVRELARANGGDVTFVPAGRGGSVFTVALARP